MRMLMTGSEQWMRDLSLGPVLTVAMGVHIINPLLELWSVPAPVYISMIEFPTMYQFMSDHGEQFAPPMLVEIRGGKPDGEVGVASHLWDGVPVVGFSRATAESGVPEPTDLVNVDRSAGPDFVDFLPRVRFDNLFH